MSKRIFTVISLILTLGMLFVLVIPASAQLGDKDESSFYIQNVSGNDGVSVTVKFVAEDGSETTPTDLGGGTTNPFTLAKDEMKLINVPDVVGLATGRYAVVISSTDKVVAVARVESTGTKQFVGSYTGFSSGSNSTIIPTVTYNWGDEGWMGMLSVMNLGSGDANVTIKLACTNEAEAGTVGTLTKNGLKPMASWTVALKNTKPDGFSTSTRCIASAEVTANQPVVAVNNQNVPAKGYTNTFEGYPDGVTKVYAPQLQKNYYGWNSAINVVKTEGGSTTVTIAYDDGTANDTCNLTDASPQCQIYHGVFHDKDGRFAATVTTSPAKKILVAVGSTKKPYSSGGYAGFAEGSGSAAVPIFMKEFGFWSTSINCQNMGTVDTKLKFDFFGKGSETHPAQILKPGDSMQLFADNVGFGTGWATSVIITPTAAGAEFACMVGTTQRQQPNPPKEGDWTFQYNAPTAD